jgi:hypothetical protein
MTEKPFYVRRHGKYLRSRRMGYFDALTSSSFKTTDDGRRLFFPWGTLGRGYDIPSEEELERLRRHVKAYMVVSLPLIIVAVTWKGFLGGVALMPVLIVPYVLWTQSQCRRLSRTDEKLTLSESVAGQARAHSTVGLWLLELGALTFVGAGVLILLLDPSNWLLAGGSIAFFGLCAVMFALMLINKRRDGKCSAVGA